MGKKIFEKLPRQRAGTKIFQYNIVDEAKGQIVGSAVTLKAAKNRAKEESRRSGHLHGISKRILLVRNYPPKRSRKR